MEPAFRLTYESDVLGHLESEERGGRELEWIRAHEARR
jgi:hypothetical protein